jgi:hypothetical protein
MVGASTCLSHVDQSASATPGFRMSQLVLTQPQALAQGLVASVVAGSVTPSDAACNMNGSATFSWLLRFDLAAGTLETGGAKPAPMPAGPYAFVDEMVQQVNTTFHVQPVTLMAPLTPSCGFSSSMGDVIIPIYLDAAATMAVLLPLHSLHFHDGAISPDQGCIGRFNAEGLQPANSCLPDATHPLFLNGASLDAFMTLEETDTVLISSLNESLCVALSGDSSMYGVKNAAGITVCKRDAAGKIVYQGGWCAATNQAATPTCADADQLQGNFASQAVKIQ